MSKAFTKEEEEIPERSGRLRSGKGLPPGALNYMTAEGAAIWRDRLAVATGEKMQDIEEILRSVTIVPGRSERPEEVLLGTTTVVENGDGQSATYRVVGVDEESLEPGWVSWVSPVGKALLGLQVGQRVRLPELGSARVVKIL